MRILFCHKYLFCNELPYERKQLLLWCLPATVFTLCAVKLKGKITLNLSLIHTGHRAAFDYSLKLEMSLLTRRPLTPYISVPIY